MVGAGALDLFAGTGAMGIEALSRGAASATFVERSPAAVAAIEGNLARTRLGDRATVLRSDVVRFLRSAPAAATSTTVTGGEDATGVVGPEVGELVFMDPPYDLPEGVLAELLGLLDEGWLVGRDRWKVCLTRPRRSSTGVVPIGWVVARRLEYGDNLIICYRREE